MAYEPCHMKIILSYPNNTGVDRLEYKHSLFCTIIFAATKVSCLLYQYFNTLAKSICALKGPQGREEE